MHHISYRSLLIAAVSILLTACNKGALPTYNDRPVVAAYLVAGSAPLVTISKQAATSSDVVFSSENVDSLHLVLSDGDNSYMLMHTDSGRYTNTDIKIEAGKTYTLDFEYNGKTVGATTTIPARPQNYTASASSISLQKIDSNTVFTPGSFTIPDPVDLSWTNDDNSYYLVVTQNLETSPEIIRDTLSFFANRPATGFRNEPSISATARIDAMQFQYFGNHRLILFKLQPDYAALYENVSNSSFSLSTPASNVTNGFGIFTGINADTLYLQVYKK